MCHLSPTQKERYKEKETPAGVNQTFGHKTSLAKSTANGRGGGRHRRRRRPFTIQPYQLYRPPPPSPSPSSESYEGRRKRDPKLPRQRDYWKLVKGPSFSSPHFTILPSPTSLPSPPFYTQTVNLESPPYPSLLRDIFHWAFSISPPSFKTT